MELEALLAGAVTDHEQLGVLLQAVRSELALPADALVIGEPVQVVAIDYEDHPRRGLSATCRRGDERHSVGLAEVRFVPGTAGARVSALYRAWLGMEPLVVNGLAAASARRHKAEAGDLDLTAPIDLVVLACKSNALRCRVAGTVRELTLRTPVRDEIPGEIITVLPSKTWTHARHPYLSGKVQRCRLDVPALSLAPLTLRPEGDWDPAEECWGEEGEPLPVWARPMVARGPRPAFAMEQVVPGADPGDLDAGPIAEAIELKDADERGEAEALLMSLLAKDLRCLDAHALLGDWESTHWPKKALRHYAVGVGIGEQALGTAFDGVLPRGLVDNRPFLHCLNGAGLSMWRLGDLAQAGAVFRRLLWLNPRDDQGAHLRLACVETGRTWSECEGAGG